MKELESLQLVAFHCHKTHNEGMPPHPEIKVGSPSHPNCVDENIHIQEAGQHWSETFMITQLYIFPSPCDNNGFSGSVQHRAFTEIINLTAFTVVMMIQIP